MTNANETNWYSNVFKGWQAKQLGAKPTAELLATVHNLGARPGKQALAIAMGLRDTGVTGSQIVIACGAPQLNKMRGFITDSLLKREAAPPVNGHTCYKLVLTKKGEARVERTVKQTADKAAAGDGTVTADKPKGKKAVKAATKRKAAVKPAQAVETVVEPVTAETPVEAGATA